MIKNLLLLFNVAALIIYKSFFADGLTITSNFPTNIKPGSSFNVELIIKKDEVAGFAKFQQELPPGFTATAIETKTGSFSFTDQTVKIIWMSLPSDSEFKISYKVVVDPGANGSFMVNGKFSYIENNEKKTFNIEPREVKIESETSAVNNQNSSETTSQNNNNESASSDATANQNQQQGENAINNTANENTSPTSTESSFTTQPGDVICKRNVPASITSEDFLVEVTIQKGDISGFAKLEESIPQGFTATGVETRNAVFSFVDQKAKFLWMNLPTEREFKVSYRVKASLGVTPASYNIDGLFSYLINDITQKSTIPPSSFGFKLSAPPTDLANTNNQKESNQNQGTTESKTSAGSTSTEKKSSPPSLTNTPTASKGVNYRVQVSATRKQVEPSVFKSAYQLNEEIFAETHEGWYKFTVGGYNEYKSARDRRVELNANKDIPGPFVAAYNNGKRITVQEALMITSQKWVR